VPLRAVLRLPELRLPYGRSRLTHPSRTGRNHLASSLLLACEQVEQTLFQWKPERRLYSVSEINARVRGIFEEEFADVWIAGEISGVRLATSGHY